MRIYGNFPSSKEGLRFAKKRLEESIKRYIIGRKFFLIEFNDGECFTIPYDKCNVIILDEKDSPIVYDFSK